MSPRQMCNMLGLGDMNADQLASKLEETLPVIRSVSEQFKDPVRLGGTREGAGVGTGTGPSQSVHIPEGNKAQGMGRDRDPSGQGW